jgi:hypothetical protein
VPEMRRTTQFANSATAAIHQGNRHERLPVPPFTSRLREFFAFLRGGTASSPTHLDEPSMNNVN